MMRPFEPITDPNVAAYYVFCGAFRVFALRKGEDTIVLTPAPRVSRWGRLFGHSRAADAITVGPDQCMRVGAVAYMGSEFHGRMAAEIARLRLEAFQRLEAGKARPASERA